MQHTKRLTKTCVHDQFIIYTGHFIKNIGHFIVYIGHSSMLKWKVHHHITKYNINNLATHIFNSKVQQYSRDGKHNVHVRTLWLSNNIER